MPEHPPTRTFKPRRRKLTAARAARYDELLARWSIPVTGTPLDLGEVFGSPRPVVLDIGFGGGEATIEMAEAEPAHSVVAVDVHTIGLSRLVERIESGLRNVRVVDGDVLDLLPRLAGPCLAGVRIFFPDPWPKPRQRHRRLVRPDVIASLTDRLCPDGWIHLATDDAGYADQMQEVCTGETRLVGGVVARPVDRPTTRYEQRGLIAGRDVVDLIYRRK